MINLQPGEVALTAAELARSTPPSALRTIYRSLEFGDVGDPEDLHDVFAQDLIDHNPLDPGAPSAYEGVKGLVAAMRLGFTDTVHRVLFAGELGDDWVVVQWELTALHTGELFGYAATGKQIRWRGIDIARIQGGRIVEFRHASELLKLTEQLRDASS